MNKINATSSWSRRQCFYSALTNHYHRHSMSSAFPATPITSIQPTVVTRPTWRTRWFTGAEAPWTAAIVGSTKQLKVSSPSFDYLPTTDWLMRSVNPSKFSDKLVHYYLLLKLINTLHSHSAPRIIMSDDVHSIPSGCLTSVDKKNNDNQSR